MSERPRPSKLVIDATQLRNKLASTNNRKAAIDKAVESKTLTDSAHLLLYVLVPLLLEVDIECLTELAKDLTGNVKDADRERQVRIIREILEGNSVQYTPMEQAIQVPPKVPRSIDPFDEDDRAVVGNNGPLHVLLEAHAKGGPRARELVNGWKDNTLGHPVFRDPQRIKGDWTVYFRNDGSTPAEAWKRVEGLSARHTKVALFFLARICDPRSKARYPSENPVGVSYEDLRNALGFKNRGKALEEFKETANTIVKDIADLEATVRGIMINGKPDGIAECPIFSISKVWHAQQVLFGEQVQIGWMVDPGPWARRYFNNDAKPWLATLHRTLLELDHRGTRRAEVLALHIATLLFVVAGGDQFKKQAITRTVAELLELAGELPEPEHRGAHWAKRTAEALSVALETLLRSKLLAAVEFGEGYPTDPDTDPEDDERDKLKRGKGWAERWLKATVTMTTPEAAAILGQVFTEPPAATPPAKVQARLEKKQKARKPVKGERFNSETAARLRAAITEHYGTQENAARFFKCTGATLSRAVNGINAPKPELAKKLLALLDSPLDG